MTATNFTSPIPMPRGIGEGDQEQSARPRRVAAIPRSTRLPGSLIATIATAIAAPASSTRVGNHAPLEVGERDRDEQRAEDEAQGQLAEVVGAQDQRP